MAIGRLFNRSSDETSERPELVLPKSLNTLYPAPKIAFVEMLGALALAWEEKAKDVIEEDANFQKRLDFLDMLGEYAEVDKHAHDLIGRSASRYSVLLVEVVEIPGMPLTSSAVQQCYRIEYGTSAEFNRDLIRDPADEAALIDALHNTGA